MSFFFQKGPREEACELIDVAYTHMRQSNGTDTIIPINLAMAQTFALIYIGDRLDALVAVTEGM